MMKTLRIAAVLPIIFALVACRTGGSDTVADTGAGAGETWQVDSKTVDCEGVAPQKCLLIKKDGEQDWSYFYDNIDGFAYEAGYRYTLRVKVSPVDNPPQDASSLHFELVEVVEKTQQ